LTSFQVLEKGELQVSGKEREAQLSSQFRDIATIVMEKTINPDTRRPYTITMIERLMHEIHFAVDPNLTSKEQVGGCSCFPSCLEIHFAVGVCFSSSSIIYIHHL
jgi:ribosome maturation protein Sdo1